MKKNNDVNSAEGKDRGKIQSLKADRDNNIGKEKNKKLKRSVIDKKTINTNSIYNEKNLSTLRKRAKVLSLALEESSETENLIDIVEFKLAGEKYGIESKFIRQVCMLNELTEIPCVPDYILGIISLHEQIISVIDIRTFFGIESPGITNLNRILVLQSESNEMEFGILADDIVGMRTFAEDSIQTSLATLSDTRAKYFYGLSKDQTIILDAYKILTDTDLTVK